MLGGTFNPPHIAHLLCAQEARAQLNLDAVWLIPTAVPPHKEAPDDPGVEVRMALCELAARGDDGILVSRIEVDRGGPSYTVDTLREIRLTHPESELTFIVGGDMARSLRSWREPEAVLELAELGVAERGNAARGDIIESLDGLRGVRDRVRFLDMPHIDVSSSDIRRRVRERRPIRHLLCDAVADHIATHDLYRPQEGPAA